jgi:hypothetical protein
MRANLYKCALRLMLNDKNISLILDKHEVMMHCIFLSLYVLLILKGEING